MSVTCEERRSLYVRPSVTATVWGRVFKKVGDCKVSCQPGFKG